jgi:8-oxo-dGTP diphosphatase
VMLEDDRYCPRCTAALEVRNAHGSERPVCPKCGKVVYYDPKLAATVVVERDGKVLMVCRDTEPGRGLWSFPGGYVDRGEVVESAAAREVLEETGLEVTITGMVGLFSEEGLPVVLAAFVGRIDGGRAVAGHEVSEVGFFPPEELPPLAFPRDRKILEKWRRLREG